MSNRRARFRVTFVRPLDGATEATVTIERSRGLMAIRLLRRRRSYEVPLAVVAEWIVWRLTKVEAAERARAKRAARAARKNTARENGK